MKKTDVNTYSAAKIVGMASRIFTKAQKVIQNGCIII